MNCHDVSLALDDRNIGALSEKERREFDAHLSECPDCALDWEIHQRMLTAPTAAMPSTLPAQVHRLVAARPGSWGRQRMRNRFILLGTLVAIGAAAAMLWMHLQVVPEPHPVAAIAAQGVAPAVTESAESDAPTPLSDSSQIEPQSAAQEVLPKEVLPPARPFSVLVMPLENKARNPTDGGTVDAMYAVFIKRLRAVPGLILLEMDPQNPQQPQVDFRLTLTGDVAGDKLIASLKGELLNPTGSHRGTFYTGLQGEVVPHCTTSLPLNADYSSCMDTEGIAINLIGGMRRIQFPPDPALRRQLQLRLLDRSLDAEQRLRALSELAIFARGYFGTGSPLPPESRPLREPVVLRAAIGLAATAADPVQRAMAWNELRGLGSTDLIRPLVNALREDANADVRLAALGTLAADYADNQRVRAAFETAAREEKQPLVRALAQRALGGADAGAAWNDYIVASLKDANRSPIERIEALYYQMNRPVSKARSFSMSSPQGVLRTLDHDSILALISVLPAAVAESETVKSSVFVVVNELAYLGDPAITAMLLANAEVDGQWLERPAAIQSLGLLASRREDPRVRAVLAKISADDPDAVLRDLAAKALQGPAPGAPVALTTDKPRLGVSTSLVSPQDNLSPELAGRLVIRTVGPDSVAQKAGLHEGDVLLEINGSQISSPKDLIGTLDTLQKGVDIEVLVSRAGQILNVKARF